MFFCNNTLDLVGTFVCCQDREQHNSIANLLLRAVAVAAGDSLK